MAKSKSKLAKWLVGILLIVLIAVGIALIVQAIYGADYGDFYLVYDGKQIRQTEDVALFFRKGSHYNFETRVAEEPMPDYELRVVPNAAADFTFAVDGVEKKWRQEGEVTDAFDISKNDAGFTLTFPADFSLLGVLQANYKGKDVELLDMRGQKTIAYYTLTLSVRREVLYEIVFSVDDLSIRLDQKGVIF